MVRVCVGDAGCGAEAELGRIALEHTVRRSYGQGGLGRRHPHPTLYTPPLAVPAWGDLVGKRANNAKECVRYASCDTVCRVAYMMSIPINCD